MLFCIEGVGILNQILGREGSGCLFQFFGLAIVAYCQVAMGKIIFVLRLILQAGFTFGTLQLIFDGAYAWGWQSMVLDYLLAFTPLGLAGVFRGKAWGIFPGTVLGCAGRFAVHYLSGVTIYRITMPTQIPGIGVFDSAELYSLVYNGCYMLPCALIALVIAGALYVPMKPYFQGRDLI